MCNVSLFYVGQLNVKFCSDDVKVEEFFFMHKNIRKIKFIVKWVLVIKSFKFNHFKVK